MTDTIRKVILLFALLSYLGSAFAMMNFSSNVMDADSSQPCANHIHSTSNDINSSDITPCDKHCALTTILFSDSHLLTEQKLALETLDKLIINFNSLDTAINLPPPK